MLGVGHNERRIGRVDHVKGSLDFRKTLIYRFKFIALAIHQQHGRTNLSPEHQGVEITDFRIPRPQIRVLWWYSEPFIPLLISERLACCLKLVVRFGAASDIEH